QQAAIHPRLSSMALTAEPRWIDAPCLRHSDARNLMSAPYPPRNPPLPTESVAHPLVAQCEGAGAVPVGRGITLHHSLDCPAQFIVLPIGKMRLQEFGDR